MKPALLLTLLLAAPAQALVPLQLSDGRSLTLGAGLRPVLRLRPDPSGTAGLDGGVLILSAGLAPWLGLLLTGGVAPGGGSAQVLDAVAQLEPSDAFRLWAGLFLPPGDRGVLAGPYLAQAWSPPWVTAGPLPGAGRSVGAAAWGRLASDQLRYQAGAFLGRDGARSPLVAGRLQLDLLEPEPGYFCAGSYLGERRVAALAAFARAQAVPSGTTWAAGGDLLLETPLGPIGWPSLEAMALDAQDGPQGALTLGWLLPLPTGPVRLQPAARGQLARGRRRVDLVLNVLALGRAVRLALDAGDERGGPAPARTLELGLQLLL